METLVKYCDEPNNDANHRQARIFRSYLIASLLGGDCRDVRFFDGRGVWYRHASFE